MSAPPFFVPAATSGEQEAVYAELARWSDTIAPVIEARVYSVTFIHDGEEWVATVGETLRGTGQSVTGRGRKRRERPIPLTDPAVVLAIFPGSPYVVVTNHRIASDAGSRWANPFLIGKPKQVVHFASGQI